MKFNQLDPQRQRKLLDKLARLKALAECPTGNVNETATAAAAMTRLMLEYQIELAELGVDDPQPQVVESDVFDQPRATGLPMWQYHLLQGLADAHHCGCLCCSQVVGIYLGSFRRATERRYCLVGASQDVDQAKRLFYYCLQEIERLCHEWNPRARVAVKNDFRLGASKGIVDKVQSELQAVVAEQEASRHSAGLVVFEAKLRAVEEHFHQRGVRSTTRSYRRPGAAAFQQGYEAGSNLDLQGRSRPALGAGTGRDRR